MTDLSPLASLDDVETLLAEPLEGRQKDRAGAVLEAVSAEVRAVTGRTWTTGEKPALLAAIAARAAERALRNPQQLSSERLGDYSRGFGEATTPGGVYLSDAEISTLQRLTDLGELVSVPTVRDAGTADGGAQQLAHGDPAPTSKE